LMQVLLDIKDAEADRTRGLKTLSVLIGPSKVVPFLVLSHIVASMAAVGWFWKDAPLQLTSLTLLVSLTSLMLVKKGSYYGYILESGKFMLWPLFCFLSTLFH